MSDHRPLIPIHHDIRSWLPDAATWPVGLLDDTHHYAALLRENRWPLWEYACNWGLIEGGLN